MSKEKILRVRMSEDERRVVDDLAKDYQMKTPDFVRYVFSFLRSARPSLIIEENNIKTVVDPLGKA